MATCWAHDANGAICRRLAVGVDTAKGYSVCKYHQTRPKPYQLSRIAQGDRFRAVHQGRVFQATLNGAWAVVEAGHPMAGWFPVVLILQDKRGRLWQWRSKVFLDFTASEVHLGLSRPGAWMAVAFPHGPLSVRPFKPHR